MSLKSTSAPEGVLQSVTDAVQRLPAPEKESDFQLDGLELSAPLRVYNLGLADVIEKDLEKAQAIAWQYFIICNDEPIRIAEVFMPDDATAKVRFGTGPFVGATVRAIAQAESLPAIAMADYEVRLLDLPEIYVTVLWLHAAQAQADDLLIPLPPDYGVIEAGKVYAPAELLEALAMVAVRRQSNFEVLSAEDNNS